MVTVYRLFGAKCASCKLGFGVSDLVMRARSHVYHVECFRCVACDRQLVPGDEFALGDDGLLCRVDHDLAIDQQQQLQFAGAGGGSAGGAATLKNLALSPPDSVSSEDIGFTSTACNNNNNNNNNETTTNNITRMQYIFQDFSFGRVSWTSWGYKISGRHDWS